MYSNIFAAWVPLYEKILLEFGNAKLLIGQILQDDDYGIEAAYDKGYIDRNDYKLVVRLLLTSTRTYKYHLAKNDPSSPTSLLVRSLIMPKFIWVAEIRDEDTPNPKSLKTEILLDPTASKYDARAFLLIRYPGGYWENRRWNASETSSDISDYSSDYEAERPFFPGNLK